MKGHRVHLFFVFFARNDNFLILISNVLKFFMELTLICYFRLTPYVFYCTGFIFVGIVSVALLTL